MDNRSIVGFSSIMGYKIESVRNINTQSLVTQTLLFLLCVFKEVMLVRPHKPIADTFIVNSNKG
jgi:hypothetical protein